MTIALLAKIYQSLMMTDNITNSKQKAFSTGHMLKNSDGLQDLILLTPNPNRI